MTRWGPQRELRCQIPPGGRVMRTRESEGGWGDEANVRRYTDERQ
jgi:hypothetical protein